jgi:hypothetical protein
VDPVHKRKALRGKLLNLIHAYRDDGPMAGVTRWKPRRVYCTNQPDHTDQPGQLFVVKFLQGQPGAAALISEVVATSLLRFAGFQTLDPFVVGVSDGFAQSCNASSDYPYRVVSGLHFGTMHRDDVEAGPPLVYDDLAKPSEVVELWVADTWLSNIDRQVDGNTLLKVTTSGKFRLIAADQSDCFCGAVSFCSDQMERRMCTARTAPSIQCLAQVLFNHGGPGLIRTAIQRVRSCVPLINNVINLVPEEWWNISRIDPERVRRVLENRAGHLEQILHPDQWEVPHGGTALFI